MPVKEKPAGQPVKEQTPVEVGIVHPFFTREEAGAVLSLIQSGWTSAVIGSRQGYELLASIEDKLVAAGAPELAK